MKTTRLGQVAEVFNGKTPSTSEQRSSGHPVLKIKDVNDRGRFAGRFDCYVDEEMAAKFKAKWLQDLDTLILNAAHNADYVGSKTYLAETGVMQSLPTGEWLVVRANERLADKRFVYFWLTSERTRRHLKDRVKGIHLYPRDVADLEILLPSLGSQQRIADILARANQVRRHARLQIEQSNEFVRSAALELIGNIADVRIPLEELLADAPNSIRTGPFGSQLLHSEFTSSGIPVLGIDNVVTNRFRWAERRYVPAEKYAQLRRYRVFPGDVMITIMGTTGRVCIAPDNLPESVSTKHLCTMTPDRSQLLPEYLWASLLWDPEVRAQAARQGKGAIMEGWNMGIVRGLLIKRAPIKEQRRFASLVQKVETLRIALELDLEESESLFGSLSQRAFNGQLVGDTNDARH